MQIFWLISPTKENYELYEEWLLAGHSKEAFFADHVKYCQRIVLESQQLLLIPAGAWSVWPPNCLQTNQAAVSQFVVDS